MSKRPPSYEELWDAYSEGRMSTTVMVSLLRHDQVFAAWCKRRVRQLREMRDIARSHITEHNAGE